MWISKATQAHVDELRKGLHITDISRARVEGENQRLQIENARLRSDLDWFKLRLNQVERERGMLIQSAIGVKISVPEFVPTFDPEEAVNPQGNPFQDLGGDGAMDGVDLNPVEDFSNMPGFARKR